MLTIETAKENFENLLIDPSFQNTDKNEAETRLKIIDRLFRECLGWEFLDISVEESYNGKYTDYIFSAPNKALIVEAKKEGIYFEIPTGNRDKRAIRSLISGNTDLKNAMTQVTDYCKERGIEFAVVCNGHQLIAFVGSRNDGIAPFDADAFVFDSLDEIKDKFNLFWNILSKKAIEDRTMFKKLSNKEEFLTFNKLSKLIPYYPGSKIRNDIQSELDNLSSIIFEDIKLEEDSKANFLKECYCSSGALSQYSMLSKQILENKYANMFEGCKEIPTIMPANTKKGVAPELIQNIYKRPILLIGDVGVGKTSFIENLMYVEAPELFHNAFTLYLDFGSKGALTTDLKEFISIEILKQFKEKYQIDFEERNFVRSVYDSDVKKMSNSIYADLKEINPNLYKQKEIEMLSEKLNNNFNHLMCSLLHIQTSWKRQLILFLDNTDQREEVIQQEVFIIANEISSSWNATVFLPMRPETFNRSNQLGHLSGYNVKAFTISPPRPEQVVEKRVDYAIKLASGEELIKKLGCHMQLSKLSNFLTVFKESFIQSRELKDFIVNISGGNIRWTLDYVRNFFGSGHVDTRKILNIYEESNSYYIPLHEFLKTVMYKNNEFYNSEEFPITNLFEVTSDDPREHFLTPLIIYYLCATTKNKTEGDYLNSKDLISILQDEGFMPQKIEEHIKRALKRKLIESSNKRIPEYMNDTPVQLRQTSIGVYHITKLIQSFTYIDGISFDTAIFDNTIFENMKNYCLANFSNIGIKERIARTEYFRNYLNKAWVEANFKSSYNWLTFSENLNVEMTKIRNKIMRIQEEIIEITK